MKKIVITSFVMPHELDDLERVLVDLNKTSKYVDGNNYEFYISFSVSDGKMEYTFEIFLMTLSDSKLSLFW